MNMIALDCCFDWARFVNSRNKCGFIRTVAFSANICRKFTYAMDDCMQLKIYAFTITKHFNRYGWCWNWIKTFRTEYYSSKRIHHLSARYLVAVDSSADISKMKPHIDFQWISLASMKCSLALEKWKEIRTYIILVRLP